MVFYALRLLSFRFRSLRVAPFCAGMFLFFNTISYLLPTNLQIYKLEALIITCIHQPIIPVVDPKISRMTKHQMRLA